MMRNQSSNTVRYVRTSRNDTKEYVRQYVRCGLRSDLRNAGNLWPMVALQLWSALNPDPTSKSTRPIADVRRYVIALVQLAEGERFRAPPRVAQVRRDKAREERRRVARAECAEKRAIAEVTAALARGEYPQIGRTAPRRSHG